MAERDFYNVNERIAYPFVTGDSFLLLPTTQELPKSAVVDAGFIMGQASGFEAGTHTLYLHSVEVLAASSTFDIRSAAPGFLTYRFLFSIPSTSSNQTVAYVGATPIAGGAEDTDVGYGFLVFGDVAAIMALGVGVHTVSGTCRIEPGLIHSEYDTAVTSVNVANAARCCPESCSREAESSSSSGPSTTPCDVNSVFVYEASMVGDILFKEGYNAIVALDEATNAIKFDARVGYGEGEPCSDIRIEGDGTGGFLSGEWCAPCDEYIQSINGQTIPDGNLILVGGSGISIEPDVDNCRVIVRLNSEYYCEA